MSTSSFSDLYPTITARLRTAGCIYAEDEALLLISAARTSDELVTMVEQRIAGLPLEHIIGWTEFCGMRIAVQQGIFVPRPRTEFLVEQAAALAPPQQAIVVDLCCGSGAVGIALSTKLDQIELHAVDIDPIAVACARSNVVAVKGQVYEGDLYQPLPRTLRGRVNILVANAPYVPTDEIRLLPREARIHESLIALDGGADGLDMQRRIARDATQWLAPGGHLLMETSKHQALQTIEIFAEHNLVSRLTHCDEREATVVIGIN